MQAVPVLHAWRQILRPSGEHVPAFALDYSRTRRNGLTLPSIVAVSTLSYEANRKPFAMRPLSTRQRHGRATPGVSARDATTPATRARDGSLPPRPYLRCLTRRAASPPSRTSRTAVRIGLDAHGKKPLVTTLPRSGLASPPRSSHRACQSQLRRVSRPICHTPCDFHISSHCFGCPLWNGTTSERKRYPPCASLDRNL